MYCCLVNFNPYTWPFKIRWNSTFRSFKHLLISCIPSASQVTLFITDTTWIWNSDIWIGRSNMNIRQIRNTIFTFAKVMMYMHEVHVFILHYMFGLRHGHNSAIVIHYNVHRLSTYQSLKLDPSKKWSPF